MPRYALDRPVVAKDAWLLDPTISFLNHGSFGAVPRDVLQQQQQLQQRLEENPAKFLVYALREALRAAADKLADFVGGSGSEYVFCENATAGCNTILNSLSFTSGDEILTTNHGYPAVLLAAQHVATATGARVVSAEVPFPLRDDAEIIDAITRKLTSRTRLVILDHVTSPTALVFPVHMLTVLCQQAGAKILIDGAHAPGMLELDVPSIGCDWYVGNCHKWLMAPKGSAFIWASPPRQEKLHPLVISHGLHKGYHAEFDWVGTRDVTSWLSVPYAIDWHLQAGGSSLRERNAALAEIAARKIADIWETEIGSPASDPCSMRTIRLPLPGSDESAIYDLRTLLLEKHRLDVAVVAFAKAMWTRISAQGYNSLPEYLRLASVVANLRK